MALTLLLTISVHARTEGDSIVVPEAPAVPPIVISVPKGVLPQYVTYFVMVATEFQDAPVMVKVAQAESSFNPANKNPYSSASGLFQILTGTWKRYSCEGSVMDASDNIECARKIYDDDGTTQWDASKSVWGKR